MHENKTAKSNSIYYRFLKLLAFAFVTSTLFFLLISQGGTLLLQSYFTKTNYMERENIRRVEDFRDYVKKNDLAATDMGEMTEWVNRQDVVWMQVYRDHILLYDSQFPYMEANPEFHVEGQFYEWDSYKMVDFQDGPAQVFLTGVYTYQFFNYALIAEFFLAFLLFIGIVMAGIRGTMKYIKKLSGEIGILEGGDLDYRITVLGNDEMAVLAKGLDNMRKSIREQMRQEAELISLNQSMITSLSHDLRTPLTALIIYTEILKNGISSHPEQMQGWVDKIDEKARQIKEMADCILKYSLQKKTVPPDAIEEEFFRSACYDTLSEACTYLEQRGFSVRAKLAWKERVIRADAVYITRIFDNICSNIVKYASQDSPVSISSFYDAACCGFLIENKKAQDVSPAESTGIGVSNIRSMMENMGGSCTVTETPTDYRICLSFLSTTS